MLAYALYATDSPLPRGRAEWTEVAIGAVFLIAAYHALLFIGETDPTVTSAAAAVTVSLSPVLTTGFARLLLPSERLTPSASSASSSDSSASRSSRNSTRATSSPAVRSRNSSSSARPRPSPSAPS